MLARKSIDGRLVGRTKMTQKVMSEGLSMDGTAEGYWHEGCCGRWNRVEGRRLCERLNALGRWKRRIEEARHASKRSRNLKLGNLLEWFGAFEQAAAAQA